MIFNEQGLLDIDGLIANESSFQQVMADGIVSEEELRQQSETVINLLREAEQRFSEQDQAFIKKLFAETHILL